MVAATTTRQLVEGEEQRSEDFPGLKMMDKAARYAVHSAYQYADGAFLVEISPCGEGHPQVVGHMTFSIPYIGSLISFLRYSYDKSFGIKLSALWWTGDSSGNREPHQYLIAEGKSSGYGPILYEIVEEARRTAL